MGREPDADQRLDAHSSTFERIAEGDVPAPKGSGLSKSPPRGVLLRCRDVDQHLVHGPFTSQSSVIASSQLGRACSLPSSREAGDFRSPPCRREAEFAFPSLPQRCACRPLPRALARPAGVPRIRLHHFGESLDPGGQAKSLEARRHARQRLDLQLSHRNRGGCDSCSWRCFPLVGIDTQSLQARGEQRRSIYFNNDRDIPTITSAR